jgi:mono/diheme cytochrome c family protein
MKRIITLIMLLGSITISLTIHGCAPEKSENNEGEENPGDTVQTITVKKTTSEAGEKLFRANCAVCHTTGTNPITGPGLGGITKKRDMEWLVKFTQNAPLMKSEGDPIAVQVDKEYAGNMNAFTFLAESEIREIYKYLESFD